MFENGGVFIVRSYKEIHKHGSFSAKYHRESGATFLKSLGRGLNSFPEI
jgi:hypothetical protein